MNILPQQRNSPTRPYGNSQSRENIFNAVFSQGIAKKQFQYKSSYANPASIVLAKRHQLATKYGYKPVLKGSRKRSKEQQRKNVCGCCNFSIENQQISIFQSVTPQKDKQFKLTQDVALYFYFIKTLVIFVLLHTITHALYNLLSSDIAGTYCQKIEGCKSQIWTKTAISNKYNRQDLINIVNILDLVAIIVSIAYFGFSRRYFYQVSQNIDRSSVSQGDFTLMINNISRIQYPQPGQNIQDLQTTLRQQLKTFLQSFVTQGIRSSAIQGSQFRKFVGNDPSNPGIIRSVTLCYNLNELQILHEQKWNHIWSFENNFILLDFCGTKIPDVFGFKSPINYIEISGNNSLEDQNKSKDGNIKRRFQTNLNEQVNYNLLDINKRNELNQIRSKVNFICQSQLKMSYELVKNKKLFFHNVNFSGNAFVSFQYENFKQYIQNIYLRNPSKFIFKGVQLKIQDGCDPTDINWYNMKIPESSRTNKICFSYIVLIMLLMFSFGILFCVQLLKRNYVITQKGGVVKFAKTQGLNLITSLIILGANSLFDFVSWFLTNLQGHATKTNFMFSHVLKTFFSRLINTVIMYFMISVILTKDYQQKKFLTSTGLVNQIYNFIVVSGLVNLIHALIKVDDIIARIKRWVLYSKRQKGDSVFTKFQISLNQQFQLPQFNLVYKYNDYLVTLYTTLFYAYLVPIAVPTLIVIFIVQYWIDKFNLFKRSSLKNSFNYNLSIYVRRVFQCSILMFALGNFIFSYYLQDFKFSVLNCISLGLAVAFAICVWVAPQKIEKKLFGQYQATDILSYTECEEQSRFKTTYWNQNPATFSLDQKLQMSKTFNNSRTMRRNASNANMRRQSDQRSYASRVRGSRD